MTEDCTEASESVETLDTPLNNEEALLCETKRGRARGIILALALLALVGGGTTYFLVSAEHQAQAELEQTWSDFNTCLVGTNQTVQRVSVRFRNIQLAAMGVPENKRGELASLPWPRRCADFGFAIAKAVSNIQPEAALAHSVRRLSKALAAQASFMANLSSPLEAAYDHAADLGLQAGRSQALEPLTPATPMTLESLPQAARFLPQPLPLTRLELASVPGGKLTFLIDDKNQEGAPALCVAEEGGTLLECKTLAVSLKPLSPGLRLWGTTEETAKPFIFAGDRGTAGIFRSSDGSRVGRGLTYGASALAGGALVRTIWNDEQSRLDYAVHTPAGGLHTRGLLKHRDVGNPYYNSGLFWNFLIYKAPVPKKGLRLLVRKVGATGRLSPITDVGGLRPVYWVANDKVPHIGACQTEDGMVVRVRGSSEQYTAFYRKGEWMPPVASAGIHGTLTCHDGTAFITHLSLNEYGETFWPYIAQTRCSPSSCSSNNVSFKKILEALPHLAPVETSHVATTEIAGKLLLVWGAGERGGLRMRIGSITNITNAADRVIYDDLFEGGILQHRSTLLETRLIAGGDFALLFLSTSRGVFVLKVDQQGHLTQVKTHFG